MLTTLGLTKPVALEATEHGITINAICPGYVLTPLVEKQSEEGQGAEHNREASRVCCSTLNHAEVCDKRSAWPCPCAALRPPQAYQYILQTSGGFL